MLLHRWQNILCVNGLWLPQPETASHTLLVNCHDTDMYTPRLLMKQLRKTFREFISLVTVYASRYTFIKITNLCCRYFVMLMSFLQNYLCQALVSSFICSVGHCRHAIPQWVVPKRIFFPPPAPSECSCHSSSPSKFVDHILQYYRQHYTYVTLLNLHGMLKV